MPKNLFGEEQEYPEGKKGGGYESPYQAFKRRNNYREAEDKAKSCGTCRHQIRSRCHGKTYYKCSWMGASSSPATDIRLKNTCDRWWGE